VRLYPASDGTPTCGDPIEFTTLRWIQAKRSRRLLHLEVEWPPNLWMGVSVENARVLARVDDLRRVPAAVRFLSCEPLLGPLTASCGNGCVPWSGGIEGVVVNLSDGARAGR